MTDKNAVEWITWVLVFVGALNIGLVGAFNFDLLGLIFGSVAWLMKLVSILIGLSALYMLYGVTKR